MGFEVFTDKYTGEEEDTKEARVTVSPKSGGFIFNTRAAELFPEADYYQYATDTENDRLAVIPASKDADNSYKATRTNGVIQMSAVRIMREFDRDIRSWDDTRSFSVTTDGEKIVIELSEEV